MGLSSETSYDVYIKANCSGSNISSYSNKLTFGTNCGIVSLPYTVDFESAKWTPSTTDSCWNITGSSPFIWDVDANGTTSPGTAPNVDHTLGNSTGQYIYTEASSATTGDVTTLETPEIDVTGMTSVDLNFWDHMAGTDMGQLAVDVNFGSMWMPLDSLVGAQQADEDSPWLERFVRINTSGNNLMRLRFRAIRGADFTSDVAIDDIAIIETPPCPAPVSPEAIPLVTSAILEWIETGTATSWVVEYGTPGFVQGSGIRVTANANPFTLTGLTAETSYEYYVRADCGGGDTSLFKGPSATFTTECTAEALPFVTDFETNWTGTTPANCWFTSITTGNTGFGWTADAGGTPSAAFTTGPLVDKTLETAAGTYLFVEANGGFVESQAILTTPFTDISGISSVNVEFWYHFHGDGIGRIDVEGFMNGIWTVIDSIVGQQQTAQTDAWLRKVIILPVTGDVFKVRFRGEMGPTTAGDMAIDDVVIKESPNCLAPSALTANALTTSAMLSWTENSGVTDNWVLEYDTAGFTQGSGTMVSVSTNPFNLTGLTADTEYDFYIRSVCNPGVDSSAWSVKKSFSTLCTMFTLPYMANFDGADWPANEINNCWTNNGTAPFLWSTRSGANSTGASTGPDNDHTQGNASGKYIFSVGTTNNGVDGEQTTIESTEIDITGVSSVDISFWYHMFGNNIDRLAVDVYMNGNWMAIDSLVGQQQTATTDAWKEKVVRLAVSGSSMKVRFRAVREGSGLTADNADIAIDDLLIRETPSCLKPENLMVSTVLSTSATINWTEANSATTWQVEYGAVGFTSGSGTKMIVSSTSATITGLMPETNYDVYVRSICAAGDTSDWSNVASFATPCAALALPFSEDFENGFTGIATIPDCWSKVNLGAAAFTWTRDQGPTPSVTSGPTGPLVDHTSGTATGRYMFTESSAGALGDATILEAPNLNITGLTSIDVSFWYHMYGATMGTLVLETSTNGAA